MPQESMEIAVARLDERLGGTQKLLAQIVDDQRRMASSYEKLVESGQRVSLVEADILYLKEGQKHLWIKVDALTAAPAKASEKWLWEIVKAALAIAGTVIAFRIFGVHP